METCDRIYATRNLKPFEYTQPFYRWILFRALSILTIALCGYAALLIVTLTMFNLIVLGVMVIYLIKLVFILEAAELK